MGRNLEYFPNKSLVRMGILSSLELKKLTINKQQEVVIMVKFSPLPGYATSRTILLMKNGSIAKMFSIKKMG